MTKILDKLLYLPLQVLGASNSHMDKLMKYMEYEMGIWQCMGSTLRPLLQLLTWNGME